MKATLLMSDRFDCFMDDIGHSRTLTIESGGSTITLEFRSEGQRAEFAAAVRGAWIANRDRLIPPLKPVTIRPVSLNPEAWK